MVDSEKGEDVEDCNPNSLMLNVLCTELATSRAMQSGLATSLHKKEPHQNDPPISRLGAVGRACPGQNSDSACSALHTRTGKRSLGQTRSRRGEKQFGAVCVESTHANRPRPRPRPLQRKQACDAPGHYSALLHTAHMLGTRHTNERWRDHFALLNQRTRTSARLPAGPKTKVAAPVQNTSVSQGALGGSEGCASNA